MRGFLIFAALGVLFRHGETAVPLVVELDEKYVATVGGTVPEVEFAVPLDNRGEAPVNEELGLIYRMKFLSLAEYDTDAGTYYPGSSRSVDLSSASIWTVAQTTPTVIDDKGGQNTFRGMRYTATPFPTGVFPSDMRIELDIMVNTVETIRVEYTNTERPYFPLNSVKTRLRVYRWFNKDDSDTARRFNELHLSASVDVRYGTTSTGASLLSTGSAKTVYARAFEGEVVAFERDSADVARILADTDITDKEQILYNEDDGVSLTSRLLSSQRMFELSPTTRTQAPNAAESRRRVSFVTHWAQTARVDDHAGPFVNVTTSPLLTRMFTDTYIAPLTKLTFTARLPYFNRELIYDPSMGSEDTMSGLNRVSVLVVVVSLAVVALLVFLFYILARGVFRESDREYFGTEEYLKLRGEGGGDDDGGGGGGDDD